VRLSTGVRKLVLAAHLTASIGWLGAVLAYIALDRRVAKAATPDAVRTAYVAMAEIAMSVILPLAVASVITGIAISLATSWGLYRHYWVVISLFLTVFAAVVLVRETRVIAEHAEIASDPARDAAEILALPSTLPHSLGGAVVLLVVLVLNVSKPRGLTRYGRRKARERRPTLGGSSAGAEK
jgi:hypothetical protein